MKNSKFLYIKFYQHTYGTDCVTGKGSSDCCWNWFLKLILLNCYYIVRSPRKPFVINLCFILHIRFSDVQLTALFWSAAGMWWWSFHLSGNPYFSCGGILVMLCTLLPTMFDQHILFLYWSLLIRDFWGIGSVFSLVWGIQFLEILFSVRTSFEKCDHEFVSLFNTLTRENIRGVFSVGCQKTKVLSKNLNSGIWNETVSENVKGFPARWWPWAFSNKSDLSVGSANNHSLFYTISCIHEMYL